MRYAVGFVYGRPGQLEDDLAVIAMPLSSS
jgi:hypothetical protein